MITREEAKEYFEKASDNSLNYHDSTDVISINSVNIILNEVYDSFEQHIKLLEAQLANTKHIKCDLELKAIKLIKILDELVDIYPNEIYDLCIKYGYYEPKDTK